MTLTPRADVAALAFGLTALAGCQQKMATQPAPRPYEANDLFANRQLNHHTEITGGVLSEASSQMLKDFFAERRAQIRALRAVRSEGGVAIDAALPRDAIPVIPVGETIEGDAEDDAASGQGA